MNAVCPQEAMPLPQQSFVDQAGTGLHPGTREKGWQAVYTSGVQDHHQLDFSVESRLCSQWGLIPSEHLSMLTLNLSHFLLQSWLSPFRGPVISGTPLLSLPIATFPDARSLTMHPDLVFWPLTVLIWGGAVPEKMMGKPRAWERQVGTVLRKVFIFLSAAQEKPS